MLLRFIRVWLPTLIVLGGVMVMVARGFDSTGLEGGAAIVGAGLAVALLNWLHRIGVSGEADRYAEDEARAYFQKFGRWPGDP